MKKMWIILKREYLSRVKSKGFIIGTILGPVLMIGIAVLPSVFALMTVGGPKKIMIYDQTKEYGEMIVSGQRIPIDKKSKTEEFFEKQGPVNQEQVEAITGKLNLQLYQGTASVEQFKKQMEDSLKKETLFGYVLIEKVDTSNIPVFSFFGISVSDFVTVSAMERRINDGFRLKNLDRLGVAPELAREINRKIEMKTIKVSDSGESEDSGAGVIVGFILGFVIYISLFLYGSLVMQSAMEEKQSRIVEVIISCVRPFDLLMGKILGVGAVALTQIGIWALAAILVALYGAVMVSAFTGSTGDLGFTLSISTAIYFVLFFILGYLIFSTLYAAIGASVENIQDAQQIMTPIAFLIIIPIMLITFVTRDPHSPLSIAVSLFPFFSPILMTARVAVTEVPFWQIASAIVLMLSTFIGCVWVAAKIYRVGVLMYGKKINFAELWRWLRY